MAVPAAIDAAKYAAALRRELIERLGLGDLGSDADADVDAGASDAGPGDFSAAPPDGGLRGLESELDEFASNDVIKAVLDAGAPPREYARDIEDRLRGAELESIADYVAESGALVALHGQMTACDAILEHMEGLLGRFQSDLGRASDEIRALQAQSVAMSTRLRNRRAVESRLGSFIEAVAVPEELVQGIMEAEVNEEFLEHLLALDRRIRFLRADATAQGSQCRRDVEVVLEKLRIKAITKVREFLMLRLYQLRKPKTNISIIQQNVLLRHKYFVRFVRDHGEDVYAELRTEYASVVGRVLAAHFRTYLSAMEKMAAPVAGQGDVLGVPPEIGGAGGAAAAFSGGVMAAMSGAMGLLGRGTGRATTEHTFELGERAAVLYQLDQPAIVPHVAEVEGKKFPYEVIFRNVHKLLADTASSEFLFCLDFWEDEPLFREIIAPVVAVVEGDLAAQIAEAWDAVGVLLMIRINAELRRLMARRRVPCLDDYLDRVHLLLWPRFKVLWDLQHASIRAGAEKVLFPANREVAVAPAAKRYAALTASVLRLMATNDEEDGVFKASAFREMLDRMWAAVFDLLLRMSNMFKDRRSGIVFLVLNFAHIGSVWRAADGAAPGPGGAGSNSGSGGGGAAAAATVGSSGGGLGIYGAAALKECEDQLSNCVGLYVEDQLGSHLRELVDFVKKAEQQAKRGAVPEGSPIPGFGPREAAGVLRDFGARWKAVIVRMHAEVGSQFADERVARDVLQASMTQLLLYYTRLLELLKKQGPEGAALAREAVNIPAIMYEIKALSGGRK